MKKKRGTASDYPRGLRQGLSEDNSIHTSQFDLELSSVHETSTSMRAAEETLIVKQARSSPSPVILIRRASPRRTAAYDTYWLFAVERQKIFFRRLRGEDPPWTLDPIISRYKFTNAYRASDRTSQYLIKHVIYTGDSAEEEVFFRTILFKLFNKIETWEILCAAVGIPNVREYSFQRYDDILTQAIDGGKRIYSAAYIMPAGAKSTSVDNRKHRHHLRLLELMMHERLPSRLVRARSMAEGFRLFRSYPSIGDFLAYQLITDINYSELTEFDENEFVMPGPGARDGIRKCFESLGDLTEADAIRFMRDNQEGEFDRLGLGFTTLWGRPLQLIDCQNLFCEVGKYSRVKHPELNGLSGRTRIKQRFAPRVHPTSVWYPPKWGINERIAGSPYDAAEYFGQSSPYPVVSARIDFQTSTI